MKHYFPFLILISIFSLACKSKFFENQSINETFNNYIHEEFPLINFNDTSFFFLLPDKYCSSCQKNVELLLDRSKESKNFYVILSPNNLLLDSIQNILLIDKKGKFEKLDLGVNGASFIIRTNKKIEFITEVTPSSHELIEINLNKYQIKD